MMHFEKVIAKCFEPILMEKIKKTLMQMWKKAMKQRTLYFSSQGKDKKTN